MPAIFPHLFALLILLFPAENARGENDTEEPGKWRGAATITIRADHDGTGEKVGQQVSSVRGDLRLTEVARLKIASDMRKQEVTGVFVVYEDDGSSKWNGTFDSSLTSTKVEACSGEVHKIKNVSRSGATSGTFSKLGAWVYYSLSEEDPLAKHIPNESYAVWGSIKKGGGAKLKHTHWCGKVVEGENRFHFNIPVGLGFSDVSPWDALKNQAKNGIPQDGKFMAENIAKQRRRRSTSGTTEHSLSQRYMADQKPRQLTNRTMSGQFSVVWSDRDHVTHSTQAQWQLNRVRPSIDAILEPEDLDEESWTPEPGETRTYRLTLSDPGPDQVNAVRFTLKDVSSHPGIASNGGNHLRFDQGNCDDCDTGRAGKLYEHHTAFGKTKLSRFYKHYNECPIDTMPDLYFTNDQELDFKMGKDKFSEGLKYTASSSVTLEEVEEREIVVKVSVRDGAATGTLRAEVQVDGVWYDTKAIGATAAGGELMLPMDVDGDGLQDKWEFHEGVSEPRIDEDTHEGDQYPGDGLSNFEEYRGIYRKILYGTGGVHRTAPRKKTIFVHDKSGIYEGPLLEVMMAYLGANLQVVPLEHDEHFHEVVNYQETPNHMVDQYLIVIVDAETNLMVYLLRNSEKKISWGDFAGRVAAVGSPQEGNNTVLMDPGEKPGSDRAINRYIAGVLGHEVGHAINIPHHGHTDQRDRVVMGRPYVAVHGGEHSGNTSCFLAYRSANWICGHKNGNECDDGDMKRFANISSYKRETLCLDPAGTGPNLHGAQLGDASSSGCLRYVQVSSRW